MKKKGCQRRQGGKYFSRESTEKLKETKAEKTKASPVGNGHFSPKMCNLFLLQFFSILWKLNFGRLKKVRLVE